MAPEKTNGFSAPTFTFVSGQLTRIENKIDSLDQRLRTVEIGLVQKEEIRALELRVRNLETSRAKIATLIAIGLFIVQLATNYIFHRFGV
jgi:hypothetical protein